MATGFANLFTGTLVVVILIVAADEQDNFQQIRSNIQDETLRGPINDDATLRRYLKASNSNVKLATSKLDRTLTWRTENNIDEILSWEAPEIVNKSLPYAITGYSYEGNPVLYYPLGKWRLRDVRRAGNTRDVSMYVNQMLERAFQATQGQKNPKTGEGVGQVICIVDLEGFNAREFRRDLFSPFFAHSRLRLLHEDHYPQLVKKWYFIRVPRSFRGLWFLYRTGLSRELRRSIEVFTGNARWEQPLLENIPISSLPSNIGGKYKTGF